MKGILIFATFAAVLALLWRTVPGEKEDAWLPEIKENLVKRRLVGFVTF